MQGSDADPAPRSQGPDDQQVQLLAEQVEISRHVSQSAVIRVAVETNERLHRVRESLVHTGVDVERVPLGHVVEAMPQVRQEGDTTIIPVVEEVVVVERRLVLKEEIRIRQVKTSSIFSEDVILREQESVISRNNERS